MKKKKKKNSYKLVVVNLWSNNYTEYKTKGDRIKTLWVEKYLNKISWNL